MPKSAQLLNSCWTPRHIKIRAEIHAAEIPPTENPRHHPRRPSTNLGVAGQWIVRKCWPWRENQSSSGFKLKTLTLCDTPISTRGKSSSCPKKNLQTRRHMVSEKHWMLPHIECIFDRVAALGQKPSFSLSAI